MKRIIICMALLAIAITCSVYAHIRVERASKGMNGRIDTILAVLPDKNTAELEEKVIELAEFWNNEEEVLAHYVRHAHIDAITTSMARLPSLARYDGFAEFSAELANIRNQMEHIRSSERFAIDNLM